MSGNIPPVGTPEQGPQRTRGDALREKLVTPKVIIGVVITALAMWFIFANTTTVRIHLWVAWVDAQLWVVLLLTFVAGALVGYLFARRRAKRTR